MFFYTLIYTLKVGLCIALVIVEFIDDVVLPDPL